MEYKLKADQGYKKFCLASLDLEFQKKQVKELEEHNLIFLFSNGPGGSEPELAKDIF